MLPIPKALKKHKGLAAAHRHAPLHEKTTAKRLGGVVTTGSGNKWDKGDVKIEGIMRLELKCTSGKSFSVTREMLTKIELAAVNRNEIPAMEVQFLNPDGSAGPTFAVVPREVLDMLVKVKSNGASS